MISSLGLIYRTDFAVLFSTKNDIALRKDIYVRRSSYIHFKRCDNSLRVLKAVPIAK